MNEGPLSGELLLSFNESQEPSLQCREGLLTKKDVGRYKCIFIDDHHLMPLSEENTKTYQELLLIQCMDDILVNDNKDFFQKMNWPIDIDLFSEQNRSAFAEMVNTNGDIFRDQLVKDYYDRDDSKKCLGYLEYSVLKSICEYHWKSLKSNTVCAKEMLNEEHFRGTSLQLPASFLIQYYFDWEQSNKLIREDLMSMLQKLKNRPDLITREHRPQNVRTFMHMAKISLDIYNTLGSMLFLDPFSGSALKMRADLLKNIAPYEKALNVKYEHPDGRILTEVIRNDHQATSCIALNEPYFMGMVQCSPVTGSDYTGCYRLGRNFVIPYYKIVQIDCGNQTIYRREED